MKHRLLYGLLLIIIAATCGLCTGRRTGQWCVYQIISAEGKCPPGTDTKSFCVKCRTPCPQNMDTTVVTTNGTKSDTCFYHLRVIDKDCKECPNNSLP